MAGCSLSLWVCHQRSYVTLRPGQSASNLQQLYGQLHRSDGLPRKPCPLAAHLGRHAAGQHRHPSLLLTSTIPRVCCNRPLSLSSFSHRIASRIIPFPFLLPHPPACLARAMRGGRTALNPCGSSINHVSNSRPGQPASSLRVVTPGFKQRHLTSKPCGLFLSRNGLGHSLDAGAAAASAAQYGGISQR